jgi:site-specific recombinase XerD
MPEKSVRIGGKLIRPTIVRYVDKKTGQRVTSNTEGARKVTSKSKTWRAVYVDADGKRQTRSLGDDRELADASLADILKREREIKAGTRTHDPYEASRLIPLLCPKCAGRGCFDEQGTAATCVENHLDDHLRHLDARNNSPKHITLTKTRLRETFESCRFCRIEDLHSGRVASWLKDRRSAGMSPATSNHYVTALKSFGKWLFMDRRHHESPLVFLTKVNARVDVRVVRRALDQEELAALISAASQRGMFRTLTGDDRAILYLLAAFTGLRASELASLSESSFNFDSNPPTLTVQAACSKHRRKDLLPLHGQLATRIQSWIKRRRQCLKENSPDVGSRSADNLDAILFPGTWKDCAAKMLKRDLNSAREKWISEADSGEERLRRQQSDFLTYESSDGKSDFHALRHKFVTDLAASGVHPKLAKELARHSSITLTMDRYAHVGLQEMNAALGTLQGMPDLPADAPGQFPTVMAVPEMVAPMVAPVSGDPGNSQGLSNETSGSPEVGLPLCKSSSDSVLREELRTPEEWWGGELNPRPAGYESAALTN